MGGGIETMVEIGWCNLTTPNYDMFAKLALS